MTVRIDGAIFDLPDAVRGFQHYTSEQRADMGGSHRLGWRQRTRIGEAFWTHELLPDVCFPTRAAALRAVLARIGHD